MSGLPKGWANTELGDVIELKYGKALPDRERSGEGYPVYGSNGIVGHHSAALTKGETIVVGRKGSVGEVSYSPIACSPIDTTYYVDQFPTENPKYWFYKLKQLDLRSLNKSTAIPGFNRGDAYSLAIQLPPLPEQKRIADKLDTVLARVDACRERLNRVSLILKRFRQSVLAAATSGKLTEDWRPQGDSNSEIGGWSKTNIGEITADLRYGTSKKCDYGVSGTAVLRIPNISSRNQFDLSDLKFAQFDETEKRKLELEVGDILIIRSNGSVDLVGKCAVVGELEKGLLFAGYLMRLRINASIADPAYIGHVLTSPLVRQKIELAARSTSGVNNINSEELRALPLWLPPIQEQQEIVRRVETLFAFADCFEARLITARTAVERLTPSLLAKAFRGELVPQDPSDEPAAALLARLHASSGNTSALSKVRKPRKSDLGNDGVATIEERAA